MITFDLERLLAYRQLLAHLDEAGVRRGGPRLTQPGDQTRWVKTWLPATRAWAEHQIAERVGTTNGWKPATRERFLSRVLNMR